MWRNPQETADLVSFTEEILNGKHHFLCIMWSHVTLKLDYCNILFDNILIYIRTDYKKFKMHDVMELQWLKKEEKTELSILIFSFKALHDQQFPNICNYKKTKPT